MLSTSTLGSISGHRAYYRDHYKPIPGSLEPIWDLNIYDLQPGTKYTVSSQHLVKDEPSSSRC